MKRLVSFVLIIFMLAGVSPVSYAEGEKAKSRNTSYDTALGLLNALGLIRFDDIETLDIESSMKRGEFIVLVNDMLGYKGVAGETKIFPDVNGSSEVRNAVNTLAKLGIVSGNTDGNFYPNNVITVNEAFKIICTALGYSVMTKGNSLDSFASISSSLKLNKGVNAVGELNKGQSYQLIYNALHAEIFKRLSYGSEKSDYTAARGINLLSEVFNVYEYNGVVYGEGKINLNGDVNLGRNEALIGSNKYECGSTNVLNFIGRNVHYYYSDNTDALTLMYLQENKGKNEVFELSAEMLLKDDSDYSRKKVYYEGENGKKDELNISEDVLVLYNNRVYNDFKDDVFKISNGSITFIDNNNDGAVDAAIIKEYTSYVVNFINADEGSIIGKYGKKFTYDAKSASVDMNIHNSEGKEYDLSELSTDNVVSIYESKDKNYIEIMVVTEALTGVINEIRNDPDGCFLEIGEKEYKVDKEYVEKLKDENPQKEYIPFKIGREAVFYIDAQNVILGVVSKQLSGTVYGYLCGAKVNNGLDENASIELFTDKGRFETYTLSSKIQLNGNRKNQAGQTYTPRSVVTSPEFYSEGSLKNQVLYCYVSNNEISNICTAKTNDEQAELSYYKNNTNDQLDHRWGIVGGEFIINDETIIFNIVDSSVTDDFQEGDIEVIKASDLQLNAKLNATLYNVDDVKYVGVMTIKNLTGESGSGKTVVIDKVSKCFYKDDETCLKVYCYSKGTVYEYYATTASAKNALSTLAFGDVVSINANNLSEIVSVTLKAAYSNRFTYNLPIRTAGSSGSASDYDYLNVRVAYINGNYAAVSADGINTRGHKLPNSITVIDDSKKRIYSGGISDVYAANSLSDYLTGAHLLLIKYYDSVSQAILYKD